MKKQRHNFGKW